MTNNLDSQILHPPVTKSTKATNIVPPLADASQVFKMFVELMPQEVEDYGCNVAVLGSPGCGKSCTVFAMAFGIAAFNPGYWIQIYKMKPGVVPFIIEKMEKYYAKMDASGTPYDKELKERLFSVRDRIEVIKKIKERRDLSIVICDEAALCMDVYSYQTSEAKSIVKKAAISRHQSCIVFACCQDNVLNKNFLSKCSLWLYKNLSDFYMRKMADEWEKDYKDTLLNLAMDKRETVFRNRLDYLKKGTNGSWDVKNGKLMSQGHFKLDFNTYMPFWDKDMSHMWKIFGMLDDTEEQELIKMKMAKIIYEQLDIEKEFVAAAKGMFQCKDWLEGLSDYEDIEPLIPKACNIAKFWRDNPSSDITKKALQKLKEIEEEEQQLKHEQIEPSMSDDEIHEFIGENHIVPITQSFPDYISLAYSNETFKANIYYKYLSGVRQEKLRKGKGSGKVPNILNLAAKTRLGYDFEDYINAILGTGYAAPHNSHEPDVIFNNRIISCKCKIKVGNQKQFDIETEFGPERDFCLQNKIDEYDVFYYNPYWTDSIVRIITLKANQCGTITIKKNAKFFIPKEYAKEYKKEVELNSVAVLREADMVS